MASSNIYSIIKFAKLSENATIPTRNTPESIGLDLYSAYEYDVPSHERCLVKTDIQLEIPTGCYGRIAPTSTLAYQDFIDIGAGVVDPDYRGNIGVLVFNFGKKPFKIEKGKRIAQIIFERAVIPIPIQTTYLSITVRGQRGLGSLNPNNF